MNEKESLECGRMHISALKPKSLWGPSAGLKPLATYVLASLARHLFATLAFLSENNPCPFLPEMDLLLCIWKLTTVPVWKSFWSTLSNKCLQKILNADTFTNICAFLCFRYISSVSFWCRLATKKHFLFSC